METYGGSSSSSSNMDLTCGGSTSSTTSLRSNSTESSSSSRRPSLSSSHSLSSNSSSHANVTPTEADLIRTRKRRQLCSGVKKPPSSLRTKKRAMASWVRRVSLVLIGFSTSVALANSALRGTADRGNTLTKSRGTRDPEKKEVLTSDEATLEEKDAFNVLNKELPDEDEKQGKHFSASSSRTPNRPPDDTRKLDIDSEGTNFAVDEEGVNTPDSVPNDNLKTSDIPMLKRFPPMSDKRRLQTAYGGPVQDQSDNSWSGGFAVTDINTIKQMKAWFFPKGTGDGAGIYIPPRYVGGNNAELLRSSGRVLSMDKGSILHLFAGVTHDHFHLSVGSSAAVTFTGTDWKNSDARFLLAQTEPQAASTLEDFRSDATQCVLGAPRLMKSNTVLQPTKIGFQVTASTITMQDDGSGSPTTEAAGLSLMKVNDPAVADTLTTALTGEQSAGQIALSNDNVINFKQAGFYQICWSHGGVWDASQGTTQMPWLWKGLAIANGYYDHNFCYDAGTATFGANSNCDPRYQRAHKCFILKKSYSNSANQYISADSQENKRTYARSCLIGGENTAIVTEASHFYTNMQATGGMRGAVFMHDKSVVSIRHSTSDVTYHPLSWTAEYAKGASSIEASAANAQCGTSTPTTKLCKYGMDCEEGSYRVELMWQRVPDTGEDVGALVGMPSPKSTLLDFSPFTIGVCWCPFQSRCLASSPQGWWMQQIGVVHYFLSKICRADDVSCANDYNGVTPSIRFKVRVGCPDNACLAASTSSRMKLAMQRPNPTITSDKSQWEPANYCRMYDVNSRKTGSLHGVTIKCPGSGDCYTQDPYVTGGAGKSIMTPADISNVNGGTDALWKDFPSGLTANDYGKGFMMMYDDHQFYERVNFHEAVTFDVCYCDDGCTANDPAGNWFKVGQMRFVGLNPVSTAYASATSPSSFSVQYIKEGGIIGFQRTPLDYDVMGLGENGILKILKDRNGVNCALDPYDDQLILNGLKSEENAVSAYKGKQQVGGVSADPNKLIFNSASLTNLVTIEQAGVIAICYCQWASVTACEKSDYWMMAGKTTVKGPAPITVASNWEISTYVVFSLEYRGFGLSNDNLLRIIHPDGMCEDNGGNPDRGSFAYTYLYHKCPSDCTPVGNPDSTTVNGDLITRVLSSQAFGCDPDLSTNCKTNFVKRITVKSETETELQFDSPPLFEAGDTIVLESGITCEPTSYQCTPEKLSILKGEYHFSDHMSNDDRATDSYVMAHELSPTDQLDVWTIPVGFKNHCYPPQSSTRADGCTSDASGRPRFRVNSGNWRRTNRATTRWEVKGEKEISGMRVCWSYGGNVGKYVTEVGALTLKASDPMRKAQVSLSTVKWGVKAPVIIHFQTATSITGQSYMRANGPTQIRMLFKDRTKFEVYRTDFAKSDITGNVEMVDASQAACGDLFLELDSDDVDNGFPTPKGCYYKEYGTGATTREIFILFDAKNGLRPNKHYFISMNAKFADLDEAEVQSTGFLEIFTMDDINISPFKAIERGIAYINRETIGCDKAASTNANPCDGPMFSPSAGFIILDGADNLRELKQGDNLRVTIRSENEQRIPTRAISASFILRLYMMPLLAWVTGDSCTMVCDNPPGSVQKCRNNAADIFDAQGNPANDLTGRCEGEPMVARFERDTNNALQLFKLPESANNVLKAVLPAYMDDLPDKIGKGYDSQTFKFSGITIPNGGFFPTRIGAQITDNLDKQPDYQISGGDYIWKTPDKGKNVAKILQVYQDGNNKPFEKDTGNTIYVRLMLGMTIFAAKPKVDGEIAASYLKITMPKGYECIIPNQEDPVNPGEYILPTLYNPWCAPETLNLYEHVRPQGRGCPDTRTTFPPGDLINPTNSHGWERTDKNVCYFLLPLHGVIYRGSALLINFLVNNPMKPMQQNDTANAWTIELAGKGEYTTLLSTGDLDFKAVHTNFTSKLAVMGEITEQVIAPAGMIGASNIVRGIVHHLLYVFFRTQQSAGELSYISIEAPQDSKPRAPQFQDRNGYSFPNPCTVTNLPHYYYALQASSAAAEIQPTHPLPGGVRVCEYEQDPFNRAVVGVNGILQGGAKYGFAIKAIAPYIYDPAQKSNWKLFTLDYLKQRIDGTRQTSPYTKGGGTESYGLYKNDIDNPPESVIPPMVTITSQAANVYKPGSGGVNVDFVMKNFQASMANIKIRITAPHGIKWKPSAGFRYKTKSGTAEDLILIQSVTASWPGGTPYRNAGDPDQKKDPDPNGGKEHVLEFSAPATYVFTPNEQVVGTSLETYGFTCRVLVPVYGPTMSLSGFFIEYGYDGQTLDTRPYAGVVPFVGVSSLVNAVVDYSTNVQGRENLLTLEIETLTALDPGSGLYVLTPENFKVLPIGVATCEIMKTSYLSPGYSNLPDFMQCIKKSYTTATQTRPVLIIAVDASGSNMLPPGRYVWSMLMINPSTPLVNEVSPTSTCGYTQCWDFFTFPNVLNVVAPDANNAIDTPIATSGFSINKKLTESTLLPLSVEERVATGRNDRPNKQNSLIFAFKMQDDASESRCTNSLAGYSRCMHLKLRGPAGFVFNDDCSPVITKQDEVFGDGNKWSPLYSLWPEEVKITECAGGPGPQATLKIEGAAGEVPMSRQLAAGLKSVGGRQLQSEPHQKFLLKNRVYVFRIGIRKNPSVTPTPNTWTVDVSDESSTAFTGFTLWTFTQLMIEPVSTARRQGATDAIPVPNPVRFTFRPHNSIPLGGTLKASAEDMASSSAEFQFVAQNFECIAVVEELDWIDSQGRAVAGMAWNPAMVSCRVDTQDPKIAYLRLISRSMETGRDYRVILEVYNPFQEIPNRQYMWKLESFSTESVIQATALDESDVTGFVINPCSYPIRKTGTVETIPLVVNKDQSGNQIRNGRMMVRDLTFTFGLPDRIEHKDVIIIMAPTGFDLQSKFAEPSRKQCQAFEWLPKDPPPDVIAYNFGDAEANPDRAPRCSKNIMIFRIMSGPGIPIEKESKIQFEIDVENPATTPFVFQNFFSVTHYRNLPMPAACTQGAISTTITTCMMDHYLDMGTIPPPGTGTILASEVIRSWDILPQLEQVEVLLTGQKKAAKSLSEISLAFTPVSDATQLRIIAQAPFGFSFTSAALPKGFNPADAIIDPLNPPTGNTIEIQVKMTKARRMSLLISNVQMANIGGQSVFDITTLGGIGTLIAMDEALDFGSRPADNSFRLPGYISKPRDPKIYSEYERKAENYPIKSGFFVQMGSMCYADFYLGFSTPVLPGHKLEISGAPYQLEIRNFRITKYDPSFANYKSQLETDEVAATVEAVSGGKLLAVIDKKSKFGAQQQGLLGLLSQSSAGGTSAFVYYTITLSMISPYSMGETWTIRTLDDGPLPTNTNDGGQSSLRPGIVAPFVLKVSAKRKAPMARIEVEVFIDPLEQSPVELKVIAPLNLNFTAGSCLAPSNQAQNILSCVPLQPVQGRAQARLGVRPGGLQGPIRVTLVMDTPQITPGTREWYVEGTSQTQVVIGWGEDKVGFKIEQMQASVLYTGVPERVSWLTFRFETKETLTNGGTIAVMHPSGFLIDCEGESLKKLSLPGPAENAIPCIVPTSPTQKTQFNLTLTETLVFGEYTFAVRATTPASTPTNNVFSIVLFAKNDPFFAADAAININGLAIQPGLDLRNHPLAWTRSQAGKLSGITIGFEVRESPKSEGKLILTRIGEILVNFPAGFKHEVDALSHVEVKKQELQSATTKTPGMFLKAGAWLDYTSKDRLRISLSSPPGLDETGIYLFTFLVTIPDQMPRNNVWTISLCEANGGCISPADQTVLVRFPVPGFALGETNQAAETQSAPATRTIKMLGLRDFGLLELVCCIWLFFWQWNW